MTGVNQTPITLRGVGGAAAKGAATAVGLALPFSKLKLLQKFRNMFKNNNTLQKFFPKAVKRITDQRTTAQKRVALKREIQGLKNQSKIGNKKNIGRMTKSM